MMTKYEKLEIAKNLFPDAQIELNYATGFQLLVAVMMSAQTTDIAVNKATSSLFADHFEAKDFEKLSYDELYENFKTIGLAKTKTNNLIKTAKIISSKYEGKIPDKRELLVDLPGVGQKTANVVLSNLYGQNYIAIDTHIERICKRLAIVPENYSVKKIEETLIRILKNKDLNQYHHSLIFFGRYYCTARNPSCAKCELKNECRYYKKTRK